MKVPILYNVRSVLQRPLSTILTALGVALALMIASGVVPAVRAARLPVVQALRHVE